MARLYISFLGLGNYEPCNYSYRGRVAARTSYVQRAEVEYFGAQSFDRLVVLMTNQSEEKHWAALRQELLELGVEEARLVRQRISQDLDPAHQWEWFEQLLDRVDPGDSIVIDMTHGFRAVPIVVSSALGYLQRVKRVELEAVLYGAHEAGATIVDMTDFYVIQEWAEGVGRLVDNADATKLAELAEEHPGDSGFAGLRDPKLVRALRQLTDVLRNVDVHAVATSAGEALKVVEGRLSAASGAERQLLSLVVEKFVSLAGAAPEGGRYDRAYLEVQLVMASMLLEHGLLMQAFTVMRELVGSLGMFGLAGTSYDKKMGSSEGRKRRKRFADTFVNMLQYEETAWKFPGETGQNRDILLPWYRQLGRERTDRLHDVVSALVKVRNGFDHAWTGTSFAAVVDSKAEPVDVLQQRGGEWLDTLRSVMKDLPDPVSNTAASRPEPGALMNLTNHRLEATPDAWSVAQVDAARALGFREVVDAPPEIAVRLAAIAPDADTAVINTTAAEIADAVVASGTVAAACVAGEPTLVVALVHALQKGGVRCFAATTRRDVLASSAGEGAVHTERVFQFVRFREYPRI